MPTRSATAVWEGDLRSGRGEVKLGSGALTAPYSFMARFENGPGTNPEELIGAASAGCFAMALSKQLGDAGHKPERLQATARVTLDRSGEGFAITRIDLALEARIPGIDEPTFHRLAEAAKAGCPVSKALAGTTIALEARLVR